tara:strand:- start:553 stop:927 length:375 start_codon:yes stop_codon:yes gene_type:complete
LSTLLSTTFRIVKNYFSFPFQGKDSQVTLIRKKHFFFPLRGKIPWWIGLDYPGALPELYRGFTGAAAGVPQQLCRSNAGVLPAYAGIGPGRLLRCFGCLERTWIAWSSCRLLEYTWTRCFECWG